MQIIFVEYSICEVVFLPNHMNFIGSMDHDFYDVYECKSWMKKNHKIICSLIGETQNEGQKCRDFSTHTTFSLKNQTYQPHSYIT